MAQMQFGIEAFNRNFTHRIGGPAGSGRGRGAYDEVVAQGRMLVGSADTVRSQLETLATTLGGNYFTGVFAYGNLTTDQIVGSVRRFAEGVMPAFQGADGA